MKARVPALAITAVGVSAAIALPEPLAIAAVMMPAVAVVVGPIVKLDRLGQALWSIAAALLGLLLPNILLETRMLHNITMLSERRTLVVLALLGVASGRCLLRIGAEVSTDERRAKLRERRGVRLTLATGLVALLAAGGALSGPAYPVMVVVFGALALVALVYHDPSRLPRVRFSRRGLLTVLLPAVLAAGLASMSFVYLPRLNEVAMQKLRERIRYGRIGFSDKLDLGNMYGMLRDSTVVMRVRGDRQPDLLRGVVFSQYSSGRWNVPVQRSLPQIVDSKAPRPEEPGWIEIEHAREPERYFLPMDAGPVRTSSGYYSLDKYRIFYPPGEDFAKRVWFRRDVTDTALPPQHNHELHVPPILRSQMRGLLAQWQLPDATPMERLAFIEKQLLTNYQYELLQESTTSTTPLADFLLVRRTGHCEYFASAFALLGRTIGIPTRVISGYRVAERSRFGYSVVRRHHAHSWVEAWVDDRWVTFDPTPADPLQATAGQTPLFSSLSDAVMTNWEALDDWLEERTALQFGLLLVLLSGGFVVLRVVRGRQSAASGESLDLPLVGYTLLRDKLAGRGLAKAPSETLHRYAARIETTTELSTQLAGDAAQALRDYADLRYAARGEGKRIDGRLHEVAKAIEAA